MWNSLNLVGEKFTRLTVLEKLPPIPGKKNQKTRWKCQCDCGSITECATDHLRLNRTKSCGCLNSEVTIARNKIGKHGHSPVGSTTRTYNSWLSIHARCENPNCIAYKYYGGRGIKMCARWRHSFSNFLEDMGERPEGMTLDRIDVNGDYEPGNCRWATLRQQALNKRNTIRVTFDGEDKPLADWLVLFSVSRGSAEYWKKKLGSWEDALEYLSGELIVNVA